MSGGDIQLTRGSEGAIQRMHPMVAQAITSGPSPETLRELLQVQRDWEAGEARKSFTRAMVALKRELPTVLARDKEVSHGAGRTQFRHTSLAAAVDAVTEPLCNHGFSVSWTPGSGEKGLVSVTCSITHEDGHTDAATLSAPPDTSGSKNPAQAVASTVTLLQRYTLLSLLGIATKDHVDPEPKTDGPKIDAATNLKAAGWVKRQGYTMEDVAQLTEGRGVQDWTAQDLERIKRECARPKEQPREPVEEG